MARSSGRAFFGSAALMDMAARMSVRAFAVLAAGSIDPFNENPNLVDDLFSLLRCASLSLSDELLSWPSLETSLQCAYAGMFCNQRVAQSAVLLYMQNVIRLGAPWRPNDMRRIASDPSFAARVSQAPRRKPMVMAAIGKFAAAIVRRLVEGAAGGMNQEAINHEDGSVTGVLLALRDLSAEHF
jgi:hypothetical protein